MSFSATSLTNYVKRRYNPQYVDNSLTAVSDSILRALPKKTDGSGESWNWLADADDAFNAAGTFATAQTAATNNSPVVGGKFSSDWYPLSGDAIITADIIGRTKNNDGAWTKAVDVAQKKTMAGLMHANAVFLQGRGWGEVSKITSISTNTFKPLIPSDITKYVIGMPLVFSSTLNSAVLDSSTVLYVTGVNYILGQEKVTMNANLSTVSANNNDWSFIADVRQNSATPSRLMYVGLGGWFPNQLTGTLNGDTDMSDSTITTLYGFSRTNNSRYYGTFIDGTQGGSKLSSIIDGVQEAAVIGNAKKLELFCSRAVFAEIAKDLNNAVRYDDNPEAKTLGTRRLLVYSDGQCEGHLNVSRTTNDTQIWGFDPSQIVMRSIGSAPHIDMEDGMTMLRQASAQGYEIRWFQQATVEVTNPAAGLRIQLA